MTLQNMHLGKATPQAGSTPRASAPARSAPRKAVIPSAGSATAERNLSEAAAKHVEEYMQTKQPSQVAIEHMELMKRTDHTKKRKENVPGSFWIDETCIDCDTCRWMAPKTFNRQNGQSAVFEQPQSHEDAVRAAQALMSCPTFSIHSAEKQDVLKEARAGLPEAIENAPGAYYCGFNSKDSFGGNGYLLLRPNGNHVLVDSPRFTPQLLKGIKELGVPKFIFLTHKDDVADHAKWAEAFGAQRIIHKGECNDHQGTTACEIQLEGEGPWRLPDEGDDVELIWTPGHTQHHIVLYHAPSKALFSGDHLAGQADDPGTFWITPDFNWYDFELQKKSVEKLLDWDFNAILPGHGRRGYVRDAAHRKESVAKMYEMYKNA